MIARWTAIMNDLFAGKVQARIEKPQGILGAGDAPYKAIIDRDGALQNEVQHLWSKGAGGDEWASVTSS